MTANDYWLSVSCLSKQSIEAVADDMRRSYPAGARSHFERCRQECSVGQGAQNPATRWFLGTRAQGKPSEKKWWDQKKNGEISGLWERVICRAGTFVYLTLVKSVGFCPVAIHLAESAKHPAGLCNKMDGWCSISWVCFQLEQPQKQATVIPKSDPDDLGWMWTAPAME